MRLRQARAVRIARRISACLAAVQAATTLFDDNAEQSKKLLNEAIDGFTASMLAMPDPNLVRENTLGRAYCERGLGKFDHAEYDHAIADFKKIIDRKSTRLN